MVDAEHGEDCDDQGSCSPECYWTVPEQTFADSASAVRVELTRSVRKIVATPLRGVSVVEVEHSAKPRPAANGTRA
jgi:hypothetical protein